MGMQTGQISQATNQMQQSTPSGKGGAGMNQDQIQSIGNMVAAGQQSPNSPTVQPTTPIGALGSAMSGLSSASPIGQVMQGAGDGFQQQGLGKSGGSITMPGQTGQPVMGQPNQYSNTTGQQPAPAYNQQQMPQAGKGKGA